MIRVNAAGRAFELFVGVGLSALLIAGGVAGCRKNGGTDAPPEPSKGDPGVFIGEGLRTIEELAPEDVIVSVNGHTLTRQNFEDSLDRSTDTYRLANPRSTGYEVKNYRNIKEKRFIGEFVTKQMLLAEAERRGLSPKPEYVSQVEALLEKRAKNEGKSTEAFLRSLGPAADEIRQDVTNQALILTVRDDQFGDGLKITDADIQAARERVERYNQMCDATNALVIARGQEICRRLKAGEDFGKLADAFTEESGVAHGFWGEFVRGEIDDAKVQHAAFTLPVGAVSDPIDTDEGLVIIKVLDRQGVDSPAATQQLVVKLGRILLQLGESRNLPDDQKLKQELEQARLAELQGEWFKELKAKVRIEYPNGTNFWRKAGAKKK